MTVIWCKEGAQIMQFSCCCSLSWDRLYTLWICPPQCKNNSNSGE